jgi:hypothetical protein
MKYFKTFGSSASRPSAQRHYVKKCKICAKKFRGNQFPRDDWAKPMEMRQKWAPRKKTCWDCFKKSEEYQKMLAKSVPG